MVIVSLSTYSQNEKPNGVTSRGVPRILPGGMHIFG
jgi:hypothetical protein